MTYAMPCSTIVGPEANPNTNITLHLQKQCENISLTMWGMFMIIII